MIDDDRPRRQLMRFRASWEQQDERRRQHQLRIRLGAEIASPLSGSQGGNFTVSQTFENSRKTESFPALGDSLARQEGRAPRSRSLTSPLRRRSRGARSRRKFSLLQSFEKSENAEILRRHREHRLFRMSTGTRAVRYRLQRCLAPPLSCVTPKPLKAPYAWAAVPTEIAEPSSIS